MSNLSGDTKREEDYFQEEATDIQRIDAINHETHQFTTLEGSRGEDVMNKQGTTPGIAPGTLPGTAPGTEGTDTPASEINARLKDAIAAIRIQTEKQVRMMSRKRDQPSAVLAALNGGGRRRRPSWTSSLAESDDGDASWRGGSSGGGDGFSPSHGMQAPPLQAPQHQNQDRQQHHHHHQNQHQQQYHHQQQQQRSAIPAGRRLHFSSTHTTPDHNQRGTLHQSGATSHEENRERDQRRSSRSLRVQYPASSVNLIQEELPHEVVVSLRSERGEKEAAPSSVSGKEEAQSHSTNQNEQKSRSTNHKEQQSYSTNHNEQQSRSTNDREQQSRSTNHNEEQSRTANETPTTRSGPESYLGHSDGSLAQHLVSAVEIQDRVFYERQASLQSLPQVEPRELLLVHAFDQLNDSRSRLEKAEESLAEKDRLISALQEKVDRLEKELADRDAELLAPAVSEAPSELAKGFQEADASTRSRMDASTSSSMGANSGYGKLSNTKTTPFWPGFNPTVQDPNAAIDLRQWTDPSSSFSKASHVSGQRTQSAAAARLALFEEALADTPTISGTSHNSHNLKARPPNLDRNVPAHAGRYVGRADTGAPPLERFKSQLQFAKENVNVALEQLRGPSTSSSR